MFSLGHVLSLVAIVLVILGVYFFAGRLRVERANKRFRYAFATFLLLSEISLWVWDYAVGHWTLAYSLPLHLCSISLLLSVVMLYRKSYRLFEFVYLAGLGGDIEALLTPDLGWYSFPHYVTLQFFVAHGGIVVACLYMIFVEGFRPTFKSLWKTLLNLNLLMVPIALVDWLTGGNYLFIREKPAGASLFDFLGPWPWYIVSLEFVAVFSFLLLYSPFAIRNLIENRKQLKSQ
ncbi:MAG: YwaF family protein [Tumebacillaceae bacterium]